MTAMQDVLQEVLEERIRQEIKWGEQNWPIGGDRVFKLRENVAKYDCTAAAQEGTLTWRHILLEEHYEVFANEDSDPEAQRAELVQVAAVAVAAIEAIDRRSRLAIQTQFDKQDRISVIPWRAPQASDPSGDGAGSEESTEREETPPAHEAQDVA